MIRAVDDQVEAVALIPFGKNDFPLAKALFDSDSPDLGQLFTTQAAEEGDREMIANDLSMPSLSQQS